MSAKFTYLKKRAFFTVFLILSFISISVAQNSGTEWWGTYDSFPSNNQLYPRKPGTNYATVRFKGNYTGSQSNIRIIVFRDADGDGNYTSAEIVSTIPIGNGPIAFNKTYNLLAEKVNYKFQLAHSSASYELDRFGVVAGDAYFITGQSNAEAKPVGLPGVSPDLDVANNEAGTANRKWIRTYGGGTNPPQWGQGDANKNYNEELNLGQFGMRIASRIVSEQSIPVCIMNGAELGNPIEYFQRNDANIYDLTTNYGRELTRLNNAGLKNSIRAVIWFQGESNTHSGSNGIILNTSQYMAKFNALYNDWDQDLGLAEKFYMIQIKPGCFTGSTPDRAGEIQEAERLLDLSNPLMEIVSTNNILQHTDNCHYRYIAGQRVGYREIGDRVFTLINRDFYGVTPPANTITPSPSYAEFTGLQSAGVPNQITMYFNRPSDDLSEINGDVKDLVQLKGGTYTINAADIYNTATLPAKNYVFRIDYTPVGTQPNPTGLAFLSPASGGAPNPDPPAIVAGGASGIGLINFNNLPIDIGILPTDPLNLRISASNGANTLKWEAENNPQFSYFVVQRSDNGTTFSDISKLQANAASGTGNYEFTDSKPNTIRNYYRIYAMKRDGKSVMSQVVAVNNRTSSTIGITVYPNPVRDRANVGVTVKKAGMASIQIYDGAGKLVSTRKISLQKGNNMFSAGEILDQSAGIYTIRVVTEDDVFNTRIVRVK